MLTALSQATTTATSTTHTNTLHGLIMRQQSLRSFNPDNNVHRFISDLNQAYTINVKPELTNYSEMEEEFLKIAKRLLELGVFQQMKDTHQDTSTFERLKSYLIATHGNQMSNFQHLSRAWDLQRRDCEWLTDFAGRLESTISEAAIHIKSKYSKDNATGMTVDIVFLLVGAMLMIEKVKAWTPKIYPHLVKTMDNHYSASGIASEAQNYLDRSINTDVTTDHDIMAYYNRPLRLKQLKDPPSQRTTFKNITYQPIIGPHLSRHAETGCETKRSAEIT